MPNEYTQDIYNGKKVSFSQFAILCARKSGVFLGVICDDKPIPENVEPNDEHLGKLQTAMERLVNIQAWDEETASKKAIVSFEEDVVRAKDHNERARQLKHKYKEMYSLAKAWDPPSENHKSIKDTMLSSLGESIESDCRLVNIPKKPMSGAAFKDLQVKAARTEIILHSSEYQTEVNAAANLSEWVQQFNASLSTPLK